MRHKINLWIYSWPDWFYDRFELPATRITCLIWGHAPAREQCGRSEHDSCQWCQKSMPHKAMQG